MTGDAVSSEQIEALLEAANWAPTHGRTEPWRFVVLGKEGIQQMQDVTEAVFTKQLQHDPPQLEVKEWLEALLFVWQEPHMLYVLWHAEHDYL